MNLDIDTAFSSSYAEARERFAAAADAAGLDLHAEVHPLLGRDGETLALDVALDGDPAASRLLLVSSGCHGIEGYCGSGAQIALLRDDAWRAEARDAGVAVLYLHALNPYGFSWWRRVTHENVDLNRNFHDFSQPLPANDGYDRIAHLLVPPVWPPAAETEQALLETGAEIGERALQAAVSSGQHRHPQGLFYGGSDPCWSNVALRRVLHERGRRCRRMGWIDIHTGLGPRGHGERICTGSLQPPDALERARAWWGPEVTSPEDGSSTSAPLTGLMWQAAPQECPQAEHTGIALEFGTVPLREVIDALRGEQWLENHPETPRAVAEPIKRRLRDAFYVDDDDWKRRVIEQAFDCARQAVAGLAA